MDLVRQSFGITLVFLLLWGGLALLKSRRIGNVGLRFALSDQRRRLEVIERLSLTPQHSIQLVRVNNHLLALGLHNSGITVLWDVTASEGTKCESPPSVL